MTGGSYSLTGGFWALYAVQTPGAPTLTIVPAGPGEDFLDTEQHELCVAGNAEPLAPSWANSPSGSTNPVVVSATLPTKFYRLFKP